jgi:uncharacterized membrane protein YraQ (UPF0718 family)
VRQLVVVRPLLRKSKVLLAALTVMLVSTTSGPLSRHLIRATYKLIPLSSDLMALVLAFVVGFCEARDAPFPRGQTVA